MSHFAVAGIQLELSAQDNLHLVRAELERLKLRFPWVDMAVLAELSLFGPNVANAQPMPGRVEESLCDMARDLDLWLVPGSLHERDGDRIYNTTPVINPRGEVVARYRKMFPFLPYEKGITPGTEFVVFDVPDVGRFGVSICYDMWFPETTRTLAWMGAEVLVHPTMTNTIDRDLELAIARTNAAVNQCYVVDVNCAGRLGNGRSIVVGPGGQRHPPGRHRQRSDSGRTRPVTGAAQSEARPARAGAGPEEFSRQYREVPALRRGPRPVRVTARTRAVGRAAAFGRVGRGIHVIWTN